MKNIGVFFSQPEKMGYPFNKPGEYWQSYQELNQEAEDAGATLYIVRSQATYLGKGVFSKSWRFQNGELIDSGKIKIDVLYKKSPFISDGAIPVLNNEEIDEICTNKWITYRLFPQYCPIAVLANTESEFLSSLNKITSATKVIKPLDGAEGDHVYIGDTAFLQKCPKKYPLIIQDFIDSSGGIPGLVEGMHDFRIALMNGKVVFSYIRTPPKNSFLANVAQGGLQTTVDPEKIPQAALDLVMAVDAQMSRFGTRYYGIDIALSPTGYKIIELNSRLGLDENSRGLIFKECKKQLVQLLINMT
ncbi:MAG: ATP-grasp domain protein [Microgenomates group bacterium GW2011_GWF2_45_18]|nr:MAG: ATP-grasp domain protein [Microgenomates group bacterium GW2011_GWF1_44_10]KKU01685.1 MAG: ATP-grasp domain protein [Microgenomates group bacterium GW2011_GWF2_45_18]OGJ41524.1 MAG: hypothetical protein A2378_00300 [Candidatus Pacebacteria bacterium RIFOXYB1_FULL_44_10]HAU99540.1 hypothetical protein [Candidatus Paceibacterota bacterium]